MKKVEGYLPIPDPNGSGILGDPESIQGGSRWAERDQQFYKQNVIVFTGNSYIKNNGRLVMGAGCAKMIRDAYPTVDKGLGNQISHLTDYNLVWLEVKGPTPFWLGAFQVKYSFQSKAQVSLIERSVKELTRVADLRPNYTFHLNYPGIGNGKLAYETVQPIVDKLPDNVHLYTI